MDASSNKLWSATLTFRRTHDTLDKMVVEFDDLIELDGWVSSYTGAAIEQMVITKNDPSTVITLAELEEDINRNAPAQDDDNEEDDEDFIIFPTPFMEGFSN